jgi:hypothetical protein
MNNLATIAPKLRKLIPRLASNHTGEVVATVRAIERVLKSGGRDWHDLAGAFCSSSNITKLENDWRATLRFCAKNTARLNGRELHFIATLADWRGTPTAKQLDWLCAIAERLRAPA